MTSVSAFCRAQLLESSRGGGVGSRDLTGNIEQVESDFRADNGVGEESLRSNYVDGGVAGFGVQVAMTRRMWFLTVNSDKWRCEAISLLVIPLATRAIKWRCRHVNSAAGLPKRAVPPCGWGAAFEMYSNKHLQSFGAKTGRQAFAYPVTHPVSRIPALAKPRSHLP